MRIQWHPGQRDYLKHMMPLGMAISDFVYYPILVYRESPKCLRNLADECASYLMLGLEGPSASMEGIKKAYRAPEARFLASRWRKST